MKRMRTLLLSAAALLCSGQALAVLHLGGTFTVDGTIVDSDTADFVYTADFDNPGWTGDSDYIFAIDFKVEGLTVDTVDSFSTTATGNWITKGGPTNANGCQDSTDSFACAEDDPFSEATGAATSGIYTWSFRITFTSPITLDDLTNPNNHIGAFFYDCDGGQGDCKGKEGLSLSTPFTPDTPDTPVPEPGSLALLGAGLLGLGLMRRRREA